MQQNPPVAPQPRQKFEALRHDLQEAQARLSRWGQVAQDYAQRYADELAPLETMEVELKARLVLCFDHACKQKELSKGQRQLASEIAAQLADETLCSLELDGTPGECDLAKLKAVYRKHAGSDFDADYADERGAADALAEEPPAALPPADAPALPEEAGALEARLAEVQAAVAGAERAFKARYRFDPEQSIDPADLMEDLEAEIADVREYIGELEFELAQFVDMQQVKAWLDAMKQQMAAQRRREARR